MISQHAEVAAKLAAELETMGLLVTAARPQPRPLEYADLAQLPYLQAVIKVLLLRLLVWLMDPASACAPCSTQKFILNLNTITVKRK